MEAKKFRVIKAPRLEAFQLEKMRVDNLYMSLSDELLAHDTKAWFDIFYTEDGKSKKLIAKDDLITSETLKKLMDNHNNIYIPKDYKKEVYKYIEKYILEHISQSTIPEIDKSKALYDNSVEVVENLFSKPITKERIKESKDAVSQIVYSILNGNITLSSLIQVSSYDYYTYTHSVDVAVYSVVLGKALGLKDNVLATIAEAAILHDIGKTKIDIKILNKQGKLTDQEFEIMKKHTTYGHEILKELGEKDEYVLLGALQHHEKIDGTGYPNGLKGKEIHPIAMIISCADIFDALTTERSYKKALSSYEALEIMEKKMAAGLNMKMLREFIIMMGKK